MTEISEDTVRADVRAWLEANWSPDHGLVEWRLKLAESGWGVPHWPSRWYGRDLPVGLVPVVEEEFKRLGAIGVAKVGIRTLAAATILEHGTDWDQPKHRGLSYFILDMKQPGVTVQPLRQMNGYASFNQVFFTDAKVEPEFLVSDVGNGWAVTRTTLMHERRGADALRSWAIPSDKPGRIYEEEREEIRTTMEPYKWYPQRAGRVDLILERARATGKINDPVLRQEIAKVLVMAKAAEWTARRARTAQEQGRPQGPEGSLGKLASSIIARAAARVHTTLLGPDALLTGDDTPMNGLLAEILVSVPATSIAGGTDEIQRNIISERVLSMPRERTGDTDKPFKDVPRNIVA